MKGTVVIGEGEKDEAPMLYFGEAIGNGLEPEVDVAVDPIEGTSLTASGLPGAISVVALAERGTMFTTHVHYMKKLVVGRKARGVIDLEMPVEWNLRKIAKAEGLPVQELTVVVLDRDRNKETIAQIREVGARIKLISAGDVAGRSEEHTSELQSQSNLVCRLLLEKKKNKNIKTYLSGQSRTSVCTPSISNGCLDDALSLQSYSPCHTFASIRITRLPCIRPPTLSPTVRPDRRR